MGIYGPRTVFCLAIKGYPGCHEFLLDNDGKWTHVKETTEIGERLYFLLGATMDGALQPDKMKRIICFLSNHLMHICR